VLLRRLVEYNDRSAQTPTDELPSLYALTPMRYVIDLASDGRFIGMTDTADASNPAARRGQRRAAPQIQRTASIKPLLLADKADYTFGFGRPDSKPDRVQACHQAYLDLLDRCATETNEEAVRAVRAFLTSTPIERLGLPLGFDPSALITFRVDGRFPIDLPSVQRFWATVNDPRAAGAPYMQCVVCGRERPVLERLQAKLKGIPSGQTSGTSVISANEAAFESYGLTASLIAPTCAECGEGFTRGANALMADETSRIIIGKSVFIFWTRGDAGFSIRDAVMSPTADVVRETFFSPLSGRSHPDVDANAFYGSVLSASGGRAVVRDWIDTTIGSVKEHLRTWFARQAIVDAFGEEPRPLGLFPLAAATVRDVGRGLAPSVPSALLRAAIVGTPLPSSLLYQAVRRTRAERDVDRPQAALMKLVMQSRSSIPRMSMREEMVRLMPEHPSPAYQCGRLLAVLEEAQRAAMPGVKAGIVDRFYGTASSAPGSVFPRLLRGARPHLARLERDRPAAWAALEARLDEIQARIVRFPTVLTLEDQGLFALGYYHQRAADRAEARAAADRRRASVTVAETAEGEN
jgi:CRISPR-associated protein Csd1